MVTRCRPLLGTFVEITVLDDDARMVDAAFDVIQHIHERMSFHEPDSDLARLRAANPGEAIEADPETVTVLRFAIALYEATNGLFDVGVGRQLVRSDFLPRDGLGHLGRYPGTAGDIEVIDDRRIRLRRRMLIDLGGIAKGYAVDRAVETLVASGAREGLVNAGGDIRLFGDRDWQVALRDADRVVRHMASLRNCAIASSSNLTDRRRTRGQMYSPHIGRNRQPVLINDRISVIADSCAIADAMTKVAMTEPDLANAILAEHGGMLYVPALVGAA